MGLGQKLLGDPQGYAEDASGGLIRRARLYELSRPSPSPGAGAASTTAWWRSRAPQRAIACSTSAAARAISRDASHLPWSQAGLSSASTRSPPVIAYATRVAPPACTFQVAAAQQLPLPDASFDLVVSSLAVHHIPPDLRPAAVREMLRVLHPGGRLFVADFRPPRNRIANHLIGALSGHAMQHNPIHELPNLMAAAGFQVTGTGDCRPMLSYVRAVRPAET
jgi:SAM-dependent methyltransferase